MLRHASNRCPRRQARMNAVPGERLGAIYLACGLQITAAKPVSSLLVSYRPLALPDSGRPEGDAPGRYLFKLAHVAFLVSYLALAGLDLSNCLDLFLTQIYPPPSGLRLGPVDASLVSHPRETQTRGGTGAGLTLR